MNNRGQNFLLSLITAVLIFIAGMLMMNHLMDDVALSRTIGIECSSDSISDGAKLTCFGIDLLIPIMILTIVSLAGGAILSRFLI